MREDSLGWGDARIHRLAFEHVSEAIVVVDRDHGRPLDANAAARNLGVDVDALVASDEAKEALREAFENARAKPIDLPATDARGAARVISLTASKVDDRRAVLALRDVTGVRALEAETRHHRRVDSLGYLTASIVHDFNNVLTPILVSAESLERNLGKPKLALDSAHEIRSAAERAAGLVRQLHAFVRKEPPKTTRVNVNEIVAGMRGILELVVGERVEIDLALDGSSGEVDVDRDQLEHVVLNLAANARDAMPDGGKLAISTANVTMEDAGEYVSIAVTDTGTGMSPEVRERLFERFFTTKEAGHGLGLGLAAAHRFVSQCSGVISVRSDVGHGTTVLVYLPRMKAKAPVFEASHSGVNRSPRGSETILVVEDDAPVRRVVRALLEEQGYRVIEAPSAADALRMIERDATAADLALVDVVMPQMSGPTFAEELRRRGRAMKVLFMSGHTDRALAEHGLFDEAAILRKAFSPATLVRKVRAALDAIDEGAGADFA